ncbi:NnrU family protein [Stappia stellulata]|uniref:NnrU family protein n=1 Tax=Stappia stellulata TaxID=71235 RepID=UPI00041FEFDE|nr:NnrU family protein [Stappia stellulata]
MTGWGEFALAFAAFLLTHSVPIRPPMRPVLVAWFGPRGFTFVYSVLSLGVLAWLIGAAGRAPHVALWFWAPWQNRLTLVLMLGACLILALSIGRPNPFSFGGAGDGRFDPARPGIVRLVRHPLLLALALWAGAHLVPNGDLAHVLLFGVFATFALMGGRLVDRRKQREMGTRWIELRKAVAAQPVMSKPASWRELCLRIGAGVALYAALLQAHPWLFGVNPLS